VKINRGLTPIKFSKQDVGAALAVFAASLWGISGACAQYVFEQKGIRIDWLVTVRLLIAGVLLLVWAWWLHPSQVMAVWRPAHSAGQLLAFGVLGMLGVQYTYFAVIEHSNAAVGTVLQYLGPTVIAVYLAAVHRRRPSHRELVAIGLAMLGTLLLVTHGEIGVLQISPEALLWGLSSALALAFYTLQPVALLKRQDSAVVVGWGMLIGGLAFAGWSQPWHIAGSWDRGTYLAVLFIVVLGTLVPFYCYLLAVKTIGPQRTSLFACAEPLSAALVSVFWLDVAFGWLDVLGSLCIVLTIYVLARSEQLKQLGSDPN
jgi:drug/metabolite transporter (DMT)-like permease